MSDLDMTTLPKLLSKGRPKPKKKRTKRKRKK